MKSGDKTFYLILKRPIDALLGMRDRSTHIRLSYDTETKDFIDNAFLWLAKLRRHTYHVKPGPEYFEPKTTITQDNSYPGLLIPLTTRTQKSRITGMDQLVPQLDKLYLETCTTQGMNEYCVSVI